MQAPGSLCPGYKHVEAFVTDDIYESEEEVSYITLDLGDVEPQLVPSSTTYRLIGLDTPTPYLQLQGTIMKGRHDLLLGTELIFTDDKENHDWNKRSLVHVTNTEQRIVFQEVTLIPKHQDTLADAAAGITTSNFQPAPSTENQTTQIDNLTGLTAMPTRASRKKKEKLSSGAAASSSTSKNSGRKKATKSSPKGKGKEKEVTSD